jgi:hypothetical protein
MNGGWDVSKGREADRQGEQAMGWNDGPGSPHFPLRFGLRGREPCGREPRDHGPGDP